MNRDKLSSRIVKVIGLNNWIRLLSKLKFFLTFRKLYYKDKRDISINWKKKTYIYIADGRTPHGGLSDRFRGIFSIYAFCKIYGYDFKINWIHPFNLVDYLTPNKVQWMIDPNQISFNLRQVDFKFFNSYSKLNHKKNLYFKLLQSNNNEIHVYTNVSIEEENYAQYFKELFKPNKLLQTYIDQIQRQIGNIPYISISFRFIALLGDFKDGRFKSLQSERGKNYYIQKCIKAIEKIHNQYPQYRKILVTTDSVTFFTQCQSIGYVYCIPGSIEHMDYIDKKTVNKNDAYMKTFLDFFTISKAEKVFCYSTGKMFKSTKFAKTAALLGGKEFHLIIE